MASVTKMCARGIIGFPNATCRVWGPIMVAAVLAIASMAYGSGTTSLTSGVPLTGLSGAAGSQVFYSIVVPPGQGELDIRISGGTGDCDLYVKRSGPPSLYDYDYRPMQLGNNETVPVADPAAGTWYIMLRGCEAYSGVTLVATYQPAVPTTLANGIPITGIYGGRNSEQLFSIDVPAGRPALVVKTWNGTGDVDLYVKRGSPPTTSDYDDSSAVGRTEEEVSISNPAAGTWYILLHAADNFNNVTLRATYESSTPGVPSPGEGHQDEVIPNLSGSLGSKTYHVFHLYGGSGSLEFFTHGGTGDCDMYIKRGSQPTTSDWDYRPSDDGNNESISLTGAIEGGDWYVLLVGDQAYSGVTLEMHCHYTAVAPQPPEGDHHGDTVTRLTEGVAVTDLAGKAGSERFFSIEVPTDTTNLVIKMSEGTGDADLYVRRGSLPTTAAYDVRPYLTGNNEQATISKPAAGTWYIMIRGYQSFSGVTLLATFDSAKADDAVVLLNGVALTGLAGGAGSEKFYKIEVPAGQTKLEITLSGGLGDADLYVRLGAKPTTREWDYRPFLFGNHETVTIDEPKAGTYYIMLRGYMSYYGVTLKALYGPVSEQVKALVNCVPVHGLSGALDSELVFKIDVPAAQGLLRIEISGGAGDADLYVKKGEKPTAKSWDYHPGLHGNDESVEILNPAAATWYVMVRGYLAFSEVTLEACFQAKK